MKVTLDTLVVAAEECDQFKYEYRKLIVSPVTIASQKLELVRDGWQVEQDSQWNELEKASSGRFIITCRRLRQVQSS